MENEILDSLDDIGYNGDVTNENIEQVLAMGTSSVAYTSLVSYLVKELCDFYDIEESVNPVTVDNHADSASCFRMELSGFLREFGCSLDMLVDGPVEKRLSDRKSCLLLLEFLIGEFQAAQIYFTDKPLEILQKRQPDQEAELSCSTCLRQILVCLSFPKPPATITPAPLFSKVVAKVSELIARYPNAIGSPMLKARLTPNQWIKVSEYNGILTNEYNLRREMLCKRLDVTIQSFLWSDKMKLKQDDALKSYQPLRLDLKSNSVVTIVDVLAARDCLLYIHKTNSNRKGAETRINKIIMGDVPDRGGRTGTMQAPPPEMPSFMKRQAGPAPVGQRGQSGGRGGGRGGRVQGGWSGGGGGGGGGGSRNQRP